MPNWCQNVLTIENMDPEFMDIIREKGFSFKVFVPIDETNSTESQLDDAVYHWGTKWDVDNGEHLAEELLQGRDVSFETAWSPPVDFLNRLFERFPNMSIILRYLEEGMGFCGWAGVDNGTFVDRCIDYSEDPEGYVKFIQDNFDPDFVIDEQGDDLHA